MTMTHEAAAETAKPEMAKPKAIRNDAAPSWPRRRRARDHFGAVAQDAGVASQDLSPKAKLSACREPFQEALAEVARVFSAISSLQTSSLEKEARGDFCLEQVLRARSHHTTRPGDRATTTPKAKSEI